MNRRNWLQIAMSGLVAGVAQRAVAQSKPGVEKAIVLYCDLAVDKAKEQQILRHFHEKFKPAAVKFDGYIDVKMLRFSHKVQGSDIARGINYRFQLTYRSLELQQIWVHSKTHIALWPGIGDCLLDQNFQVLVFDNA